jgi:hypothetical protein
VAPDWAHTDTAQLFHPGFGILRRRASRTLSGRYRLVLSTKRWEIIAVESAPNAYEQKAKGSVR